MKKSMIALPLLFLLNTAWAYDCDYRLSLPNASVQPMATNQTIQQTFTIERRDPSVGHCAVYRLYFGKGFANSYQRKALDSFLNPYHYNLHSNVNLSGVLKERNDALNSSEFIQGQLDSRNTVYNGNFYLSLPALSSQTNQKAGLYTDIVQISIFRVHSNGELEFQKTQNYSVYINVPTELNVSLVNEGDAFNVNSTTKILDFGNLEENETLGADIIVGANTSYQLKVSSMNNGKLVNNTTVINYQFSVNGTNVPLNASKNNPVTIGTGSGPTAVAGERYNAKVRILNIPENPDTGVYSDAITITAIAN